MAHNDPFHYDIAGRLLWERDAKRAGMTLEAKLAGDPPRLWYRFEIEVPAYDDRRTVNVMLNSTSSHDQPVVFIDGPVCRRHRYQNNSLCMWYEPDPPSERWVPDDGLIGLVGHIELHAWCETECRAGKSWPKLEAPGSHPRLACCPSCRGRPRN